MAPHDLGPLFSKETGEQINSVLLLPDSTQQEDWVHGLLVSETRLFVATMKTQISQDFEGLLTHSLTHSPPVLAPEFCLLLESFRQNIIISGQL